MKKLIPGCVHSQKINECHTHSHTWKGTINQKIAPFGYLDITDMDMWMLNECYYNGNSALTNPSLLKWDPNLGNVSFTSQGNYAHATNPQSGTDGNGRLVFFVTAGDQKVNLDKSGEYADSDLYYKMQITPRYWLLNLDTNAYTPLDVYMGQSGNYKSVAAFDCDSSVSEYYLYMDWQNEYQRRNYTG